MKIAIVVHTQTGNTLSVAEKLQKGLTAAGHAVTLEKYVTVNNQKGPFDVKPEKLSGLGAYDALVLAAPVQAFSVSPMMKAILAQLPALNGKKVALFVTKGLPFNWTGGNKAISQMKSAVESKGGNVVGTSILVWGGAGGRDKKISDLVGQFTALFK